MYWCEPVIQARPLMLGTMARRSPTVTARRSLPTNSELMMDVALKSWPGVICPFAASKAMRADTAVPVGDLSTLPGSIATAERAVKPVGVVLRGPANKQKETCCQSGR